MSEPLITIDPEIILLVLLTLIFHLIVYIDIVAAHLFA
jgi:hypothetical protein